MSNRPKSKKAVSVQFSSQILIYNMLQVVKHLTRRTAGVGNDRRATRGGKRVSAISWLVSFHRLYAYKSFDLIRTRILGVMTAAISGLNLNVYISDCMIISLIPVYILSAIFFRIFFNFC